MQNETINPIPMRITCPECRLLHIDEGEFATKPHHTHSCQGCGLTWRPAVVHTVGVRFLPGFKNASPAPDGKLCVECKEPLSPETAALANCHAVCPVVARAMSATAGKGAP